MRCPHCGAEVRSDDLFCPECGSQLSAVRRISAAVGRRPIVVAVLAVATTVCLGGALVLRLPLAGSRTTVPEPSSAPIPTSIPRVPPPAALPVEGADPQEPDDTIAEAAPITTDGQPQMHNLHIEGDHDYVCFEATTGNAYTIETQDLGGDIDPIMYLYDSEGQELARNDDASLDTLAPRLVWVAPSSGRYCVMVRDLAEDATGIDANYSITVRESAFAEGADQYEPDDTLSEASPIQSDGTRQKHTFHTSTEVDYVSFAAQEGVEYTIETGSLEAGSDTVLYLYDEAGAELGYDDDASDEALASYIVWTAPSSGTYYVMIRDFGAQAGPAVSYEVWISAQ